MPDIRTRRGVDRRPLISYLRVQQDSERRMLALLRSSSTRISSELKRLQSVSGVGAGVRLEQLGMAQAAIHRENAKLFRRLGDEIAAGKAEAAAAAVESMHPPELLKKVFPPDDLDYLLKSAKAQAARGIEAVEARQTLSYVPLSDKVYHTQHLVDGKIDEIINSALARGASAAELAKDVRQFIDPNTPGGARYAAMRLGRTELNNAFHAQQVQEGIKTPWTTGMLWNLSGSHPRPDECNEYADDTHYEGGEAGVFLPEEVPAKPHPNCLCFCTPETLSPDEFVRRFEEGRYDTYLRDELGLEDSLAAPGVPGALVSTDPFPELPRLVAPSSYDASLGLANKATRQEYKNNCHFCVNAMEMRARGYDVVAAQTYKDSGRYVHSIARDWVDPGTGEVRKPKYAVPRKAGNEDTLAAVKRTTEDWPPNSRGFINGEWDSGGAHVFNVYKDDKGVLHFVDGQVGRKNASTYLKRMKKVQVMRVDDLEPVPERLRDAVRAEIEKVTNKTQLKAIQALYNQLRDDFPTSGPLASSYQWEMNRLYRIMVDKFGVNPDQEELDRLFGTKKS